MTIHKINGKATASDPTRKVLEPNLDKLELSQEDSIVFCWIDELETEWQHSSGIVIARTLDRKKDRWGKVLKVHPSIKDIKYGDYILPEKTHEPFGGVWEGLEIWMTYSKDITLVTPDKSFTETLNEN